MALNDRCVEQAPVILRRDRDLSRDEKLHRPFHGSPPDHVIPNSIEPLERKAKTAFRAQQLVEVLARHPVRPERPFEIRVRDLLQRSLPGKPLDIEDVLDPGRTLAGERIAVVRRHHGVDDMRDSALGQRAVDKVPVGRRAVERGQEHRVIDRFQQPLPAGGAVVRHRHIHEVPGNLAAAPLPAKFGEPAVVSFGLDSDTRLPGKRLEIGLFLAAFVGTAPCRHSDGPGRGRAGVRRRSEKPDGRQRESGASADDRPNRNLLHGPRGQRRAFRPPHSLPGECRSSYPDKL